jgi:hypothetical protein
MKVYIPFSIIACLLSTLAMNCGCSAGDREDGSSFEMPSMGYIADETFVKVIDAIEESDPDALRSLFSERALSEAHDFTSGADYLISLAPDGIASWERTTIYSSEEVENGKYTRYVASWYKVYSNDGAMYRFFVLNYYRDTQSPDNQGVYSIRGVHEDYLASNWGDMAEMRVPGIYIPDLGDPVP